MISKNFREILKNRSFLALWGAQFISQMALNMLNFLLAILVYDMTQSNIAVSILFICFGAPTLFFSLMAGVLVDRTDRKLILVSTNLLRMFLVLTLSISFRLPLIFLVAFLASSAAQFFIPAEGASIPALVSQDDLLLANSLFTFTLYVSMAFGYMAAGPALRYLGPRVIFPFTAILFLLASFLVNTLPGKVDDYLWNPNNLGNIVNGILKLGEPQGFIRKKLLNSNLFTTIAKGAQEGYVFIKSESKVFSSIILIAIANIFIAILVVLAPGFVVEVLKTHIEDAAFFVMAPASLGIICGALLLSRFGHLLPRKVIVNLGLFLAGLIVVLASFANHPKIPYLTSFTYINTSKAVIFLLYLLGMANTMIVIPSQATLQENTPSALRGRVYGVLNTAVSLAALFPILISGFLADFLGVSSILFLIGILLFSLGVVRIFFSLKED